MRNLRIAFLVLTHNNPAVLERTVKELSTEDCTFFIHVDRKAEIEKFRRIQGKNTIFAETRVAVYWGEFSQIESVLTLFREVFDRPEVFDYMVLISGSDYPLRSGKYIQTFFEENRGIEFMSMVKMPNNEAGKPISRINTLRYPSTKPVRRFVSLLLAKLGLSQRDYRASLRNLEPYSGSTWWALTTEACQYILKFTDQNPKLKEYFQNVFAPDESFFHTILGNSEFKSRMRRNLVYEDWSEHGAHPMMIGDKHIALFEAQDKVCVRDVYGSGEVLFARKFSDSRLDLLDKIDALIRQKEEDLSQFGANR